MLHYLQWDFNDCNLSSVAEENPEGPSFPRSGKHVSGHEETEHGLLEKGDTQMHKEQEKGSCRVCSLLQDDPNLVSGLFRLHSTLFYSVSEHKMFSPFSVCTTWISLERAAGQPFSLMGQ